MMRIIDWFTNSDTRAAIGIVVVLPAIVLILDGAPIIETLLGASAIGVILAVLLHGRR